jgi:hypothetical protein
MSDQQTAAPIAFGYIVPKLAEISDKVLFDDA